MFREFKEELGLFVNFAPPLRKCLREGARVEIVAFDFCAHPAIHLVDGVDAEPTAWTFDVDVAFAEPAVGRVDEPLRENGQENSRVFI